MTTEEQLAKLLACAVWRLGGSLDISKELLDNMFPVRLILDETSDPHKITLAIISNEVITLVIDKDGTTEVM